MAHAVEAWAREQAGHTGPDRAHIRQYADQTGIPIEEALAKFGYRDLEAEADRPEIPEGYEFIWEWFFELAQTRQQTGFGASPISWQEMVAWAHITGVELYPSIAMCLVAMDRAWLKVAAEQGKKDGE